MLLPVFFLGCIHALCSSHTRLVRLLRAALLANLLAQGLLQAAGVWDLPQMLPATHALLAVSVFAGLYVLVSRLRRTHSPALRWLAAIYVLLAVAGLAALVEFYLRPYTDNSRLFRVGLYLGLGLWRFWGCGSCCVLCATAARPAPGIGWRWWIRSPAWAAARRWKRR